MISGAGIRLLSREDSHRLPVAGPWLLGRRTGGGMPHEMGLCHRGSRASIRPSTALARRRSNFRWHEDAPEGGFAPRRRFCIRRSAKCGRRKAQPCTWEEIKKALRSSSPTRSFRSRSSRSAASASRHWQGTLPLPSTPWDVLQALSRQAAHPVRGHQRLRAATAHVNRCLRWAGSSGEKLEQNIHPTAVRLG
jgi:hypothetical protein